MSEQARTLTTKAEPRWLPLRWRFRTRRSGRCMRATVGSRSCWNRPENQILQAEMTDHLGAESGERADSRAGYRNGTYERKLACLRGPASARGKWFPVAGGLQSTGSGRDAPAISRFEEVSDEAILDEQPPRETAVAGPLAERGNSRGWPAPALCSDLLVAAPLPATEMAG